MADLCPKKEICGSCTLSDKSYPEQLTGKLKIINESFTHLGLGKACLSVIHSPQTEHYRNRMDYAIDYQRNVGLKEKGKWWKVIDGHTCFIADTKIEEIFYQVRNWVKATDLSCWDRKENKGLLRYFVVRSTSLGETMINMITSIPADDIEKERCIAQFTSLAKETGVTTLIWSVNKTTSDVSFGEEISILFGKGFIEENIGGITYKIVPDAFFQTNFYTSPLLQKLVIDLVEKSQVSKVLDLYCGSGFFTLPISKLGKNAVGVELSAEAIETAKENAMLNKVPVDFYCQKSEDYDLELTPEDLLLVDPPRSGLHPKVTEKILSNKPKNIIYVSCNQKTFFNDLEKLILYYQVTESHGVDMFPHTPHVELVTYLTVKY